MSSGTMLVCSSCGNEEPAGSRFCGNCGAPFAAGDQPAADEATDVVALLTCASCGNREPEGSQFCGTCGAPFVPADQQPAETSSMEVREPAGAALAPETPAPAVEPPSRVELPTPPPSGNRRLRWIAAGAAGVLLVAGGATVGALALTGKDDPVVVTTTEPEPPVATTESIPPVSSPTLVDTMTPRLAELVGYQGALSTRVGSLRAGVGSFAAVRRAAGALAASVVGTQRVLEGFSPADSTEANTLALLQRALASHLAYAEALSSLPPRPRSFTTAQAKAAIDRAEQVQTDYSTLAAADPALTGIALNTFDHVRLLELVPAANQTFSTSGRTVIDLVPLLVGMRPDDPLGEGRCFGPYTSRASLRVSGVVHRSGFVQCGDDANGDPSRASGVYRFSSRTFRTGPRIVRLTGQVAIDESSSSSQRGSRVTWTVLYNGTPICSETVVWSGSRPSPKELDCRVPMLATAGGFDVGRLEVRQVASLASSGDMWAGLLDPTIVAAVPR
jgi:hypothetical protein